MLMSVVGILNRMIAEHADCSPQWVRQIIYLFNERGIEGSDRTPTRGIEPGSRRSSGDVSVSCSQRD
jgi:hypothetical protein